MYKSFVPKISLVSIILVSFGIFCWDTLYVYNQYTTDVTKINIHVHVFQYKFVLSLWSYSPEFPLRGDIFTLIPNHRNRIYVNL